MHCLLTNIVKDLKKIVWLFVLLTCFDTKFKSEMSKNISSQKLHYIQVWYVSSS